MLQFLIAIIIRMIFLVLTLGLFARCKWWFFSCFCRLTYGNGCGMKKDLMTFLVRFYYEEMNGHVFARSFECLQILKILIPSQEIYCRSLFLDKILHQWATKLTDFIPVVMNSLPINKSKNQAYFFGTGSHFWFTFVHCSLWNCSNYSFFGIWYLCICLLQIDCCPQTQFCWMACWFQCVSSVWQNHLEFWSYSPSTHSMGEAAVSLVLELLTLWMHLFSCSPGEVSQWELFQDTFFYKTSGRC